MGMVNNMKECMLEFMEHLILQGAKCLKDMVLNGLFNIVKKNGKIEKIEDQNI